MRLKYRMDVEDIVQFNLYLMRNDPFLKRQQASIKWGFTAVIVVGLVFLGLFLKHWIPFAAATIFLAIILFLFPRFVKNQIIKSVQKGTRNLPSDEELEISAEGITNQSKNDETFVKWAGILKIGFTDQHAFIHIDHHKAWVIPKNSILEGDYEAFVEELKKAFQKYSDLGGD